MTASGFPWLKWFPRDFASSTRGWPLVARGVYRELLDCQWDLGGSQPGILPDDPEQLRELARARASEWKVAWRFVARKFPRVAGGRQNARLEEHRKASIRELTGRQKGAQRTNAKRWGDRSASQSANRSATENGAGCDRSATNERLATSSSSSAREEEDVRGLRRSGGTVESSPDSAVAHAGKRIER
jgi:uncharacterized protein YdaU (DUF1376 family)